MEYTEKQQQSLLEAFAHRYGKTINDNVYFENENGFDYVPHKYYTRSVYDIIDKLEADADESSAYAYDVVRGATDVLISEIDELVKIIKEL